MSEDALARLRALCLAYPEAMEGAGVGSPSFRVRDKIFAMQHLMNGRISVWCKAQLGAQRILVGSDPNRYFVPPYVGRHGWVGVYLDVAPDWEQLADLVDDSYCMTAPRRLLAQLDAGADRAQ